MLTRSCLSLADHVLMCRLSILDIRAPLGGEESRGKAHTKESLKQCKSRQLGI